MHDSNGNNVDPSGYSVEFGLRTEVRHIKYGDPLGFDPLDMTYLFDLSEKKIPPIKVLGESIRVCDTVHGLFRYLSKDEMDLGNALIWRYKQICKVIELKELCSACDAGFLLSLEYQKDRLSEVIYGKNYFIDFRIYHEGGEAFLAVSIHPRARRKNALRREHPDRAS